MSPASKDNFKANNHCLKLLHRKKEGNERPFEASWLTAMIRFKTKSKVFDWFVNSCFRNKMTKQSEKTARVYKAYGYCHSRDFSYLLRFAYAFTVKQERPSKLSLRCLYP